MRSCSKKGAGAQAGVSCEVGFIFMGISKHKNTCTCFIYLYTRWSDFLLDNKRTIPFQSVCLI